MPGLLAIGISHKTAPVALREKLALTSGQAEGLVAGLRVHNEVHEAVALSTCNRTELYFVTDDAVTAESIALGYLAVQLTLSYFVSGWVKVINPDWRSGQALIDVFRHSAYPVSQQLRRLADFPRLLFTAGWAVIGLELVFPLTLLDPRALAVGLALCAMFHVSNAIHFGLNRFVWAWISAFPALIWFQGRLGQILF